MNTMMEVQALRREGISAPLISELSKVVRFADSSAVVVEPHVITRIIKHDRRMTGILIRVPHERCYFIHRRALEGIADAEELHVDDIRSLPQTVILLSCPQLIDGSPVLLPESLLELQRQLFHVKVHLAVQQRLNESALTAAVLRQRIHRIGQAEFDEVRFVLRREHLLLPPQDDPSVYAEFAATYLELRHFARWLLPRYFPTIWHGQDIEAILAEDVDVLTLLDRSRIEGAAQPGDDEVDIEASASGPAPPEAAPLKPSPRRRSKLLARAEEARKAGNAVRAAILQTQAAWADSRESPEQYEDAYDTLDSLARRLADAFRLGPDEYHRWRTALRPLLLGAAQGSWPVEARLLYELQSVCIDHEQELFSVDVVQWLLAAGRRPFRLPLPLKQKVVIVRSLRGVMQKLATARLEEAHRRELLSLLRQAVRNREGLLGERLRAGICGAMTDIGLTPQSLPERVARDKIIEELLDRITERGFLTLGDLRDAISRNSLKLPDVGGPLRPAGPGARSLIRACVPWCFTATANVLHGGKLLRLDRKLSIVLDGAYRRGDFYMRWLHRLSQLAFGTWLGRALTRCVLVPFGGAFIILEGLKHVVHLAIEPIMPVDVKWLSIGSVVCLGLYLLAVVNLPPVLTASQWLFRSVFRLVRLIVLDTPRWLASRDIVRRFCLSRPYRVFQAYVLSPLLVTCLAWGVLWLRRVDEKMLGVLTGAIFLVLSLLLNTRPGRRLQELTAIRATYAWQYMRRNILWGTIQIIVHAFKTGLELLERLLYAMDEWLRFRAGGSTFSLVAKSILGLPWFIVSYALRFVVNLLIEPQVNPVKHFPVVTVSHKLLLPTIPSMGDFLGRTVGMSPVAADTVATTIIGTIPGLFGFLVWELMGNWRLFQANRPRNLPRTAVGSHGESVVQLMKPGLHSGRLPKLYARMRHAEVKATPGVPSRKLRGLRRQAHHIEESMRHFAERELVRLLSLSRGWGGCEIAVGQVHLGSNRIAMELRCPSLNGGPLWLAFEEQSGWLLAGVARTGWLWALSDHQRQTLAAALAGFYKAAGVDMIREQIEACLGPEKVPYDVAQTSLVAWPGVGEDTIENSYEAEVVYDFSRGRRLVPRVSAGKARQMPILDARTILFRDTPILRNEWLAVWGSDAEWPEAIAKGIRILPSSPTLTGGDAQRSALRTGQVEALSADCRQAEDCL